MQRNEPLVPGVYQSIMEERNAINPARLRYLQSEYNRLQDERQRGDITTQGLEYLQRIIGEMRNLQAAQPVNRQIHYRAAQLVDRQILEDSRFPRRGYNTDELKSFLIQLGIRYPAGARKDQLIDILSYYVNS